MEYIKNNQLILGLSCSGKKIIHSTVSIKKKIIFPFSEIFYVTEESFIAAKFLSHLSNSLLRVINNDTYEEMSLVFNRLAPGMFTKNKVNDLICLQSSDIVFL
jgi:hypothetical protein